MSRFLRYCCVGSNSSNTISSNTEDAAIEASPSNTANNDNAIVESAPSSSRPIQLNITELQKKAANYMFAAEQLELDATRYMDKLWEYNFGAKLSARLSKSIIEDVIGTHFMEQLKNDIGSSMYSLMLADTIDAASKRVLGIKIVYYSQTKSRLVTTFLSIVPVYDQFHQAVIRVLTTWDLPIYNIVAIVTDNAIAPHVNIENFIPQAIFIRCGYQTVSQSVEHACRIFFGGEPDYILWQTRNWFNVRPNMIDEYRLLYQSIHETDPEVLCPMNSAKYVEVFKVVKQIEHQWETLKTMLQNVEQADIIGQSLRKLYNNDTNYVLFFFALPILEEMYNLSEILKLKPKTLVAIENIFNTIEFLKTQIQIDQLENITLENVKEVNENLNLGSRFDEFLRSRNISGSEELKIREKCVNFIISLITVLRNSLPNIHIIEIIDAFSVATVLATPKPNLDMILPHLNLDQIFCETIKNQYASIGDIKWVCKNSDEAFWSEVLRYKDGNGENPFMDLAEFAITLVCIPLSYLNMEEIKYKHDDFNLYNATKHIRYGLKMHGAYFHNYLLPRECLNAIIAQQEADVAKYNIDELPKIDWLSDEEMLDDTYGDSDVDSDSIFD